MYHLPVAMNIKNDETQRLSRELADLTGESVTTAVTIAVRERLVRLRSEGGVDADRARRIKQLGAQISVALAATSLTVEDLYDADGLPA